MGGIPMVFTEALYIIVGFALLGISADEAIKRLVRLSRHFGVSEFTISFLVAGIVAISPELSIGISAALAGNSSFALGIVLGSNVADLTLVMGLIALSAGAIQLHRHTIFTMAWLLAPLALPVVLLLDGSLSRTDGILLLAAFAIYATKMLSDRPKKIQQEKPQITKKVLRDTLMLLGSLALLLASGYVISGAAERLSAELALPLIFMGTLLAVGTCLPELTMAFEAARKKHGELGFGNIFGNVLADCMLTLGIITIIQPIKPEFPQLAILSGLFSLLAASIALVLIKRKGDNKLHRKDAMVFFALYALFLGVQTLAEKILAG